MTQESEFERLEEFVRQLLGRFDLLRDEKKRLEIVVQQKDEKIADLKAELASVQNERGDISARVSNLLSQIEEWEKDLADDFSSDGDTNLNIEEKSEIVETSRQDPEEKSTEEKDRSLQQNLFNVRPRISDMGD